MNSQKPIQIRTYGNPDSPTKIALLHGGPGAQGDLRPLARLLESQTDWHILEPIQRYGTDQNPLTVQTHIDDLAQTLPQNTIVLGHSWGAMLALALAADRPNAPKSLILVGCGTYSKTSRAEFERLRESLTPDHLKTQKQELKQQLAQTTDPTEKEKLFTQLGEISDAAYYVDRLPSEPNDLPFDPLGHTQTWQDALRRQSEGIDPQSFKTITCPVTLIQGKQDPHPGPAIQTDLLPHIPHLTYHELDQCGHSPWLERQAQTPFLQLLKTLVQESTKTNT